MFSAAEAPPPFHVTAVRRLRRAHALLTAFATALAILVSPTSQAIPGQPGTLDITFGSGTGKVITAMGSGEDTANAIAVQPDGKLVVAGSCFNGTDDDFCLARYSANGVLDTTFGSGGKVTTDLFGSRENANSIAVQPDGKIVVAGSCNVIAGREFCLARYSANGVLDPTFGDGGTVWTTVTFLDDFANALAIQPDGKFVVAGYCYHGGLGSDFCLARYNTNGGLDTTFGSAGLVFTDLSTYDDEARSLVVQPDGKILVAGSCSNSFCLARYNANGALDATFGSSGTVIAFGGGSYGRALALRPDGWIVVAGECYAGGWDLCLVRFSANGALDPSFGGSGKVVTPMGSDNDYARALALQPDGRIVVAGYCWNGTRNDICLARYNASGALDTSFNNTGKVITPIGSSDSVATALALQPDGKIVVAGYCSNGSNNDFCLGRYEGGPFDARNCSMDIDGDGAVLATTDALILARVSLGLTSNAVIGGITFAAHASRQTWADIRTYLVAQCGMSIVP
jgi:uncharacterized delta-60 repeat protein